MTLHGAHNKNSASAVNEANIACAHWILANNLSLNTAENFLIHCFIQKVQQCGSSYKPPSNYEVGGKLMDATFECYYDKQLMLLMQDADMIGITMYGDGTTITTTAKINIMASSPGNLHVF